MKSEINWAHWRQLRSVKVWEACLLSLNFDPGKVQPEFAPAMFVLTPSFHQFVRNLTSPSFSTSEYARRLRLICNYLGQVESFSEVLRSGANKNAWEISLHEFCLLADRIDLELPPAMKQLFADSTSVSSLHSGSAKISVEEPPTPLIQEGSHRWHTIALELAKAEKKRAQQLSLAQISVNVQMQMTKMHDLGHQNVTGRGNRVPNAATILRHALKNFSS